MKLHYIKHRLIASSYLCKVYISIMLEWHCVSALCFHLAHFKTMQHSPADSNQYDFRLRKQQKLFHLLFCVVSLLYYTCVSKCFNTRFWFFFDLFLTLICSYLQFLTRVCSCLPQQVCEAFGQALPEAKDIPALSTKQTEYSTNIETFIVIYLLSCK